MRSFQVQVCGGLIHLVKILLRLFVKILLLRWRLVRLPYFTRMLFFVFVLSSIDAIANAGKPQPGDILKFAVIGVSGNQREALLNLAYEFEQQNRDNYVRLVFLEDATLKREIPAWMSGEEEMDLVLWQAGERLFKYVRQNQVTKLNDFWQTEKLADIFPSSVLPLISQNNDIYAIPMSYYNWGFYYNRQLFDRLGVSEPLTWDDLLHTVKVLRAKKINPITIASKEYWPVSAWFEYINLRTNGLEFHQQVTKGEVSFESDEIKDVLKKWAELLDVAQYNQEHRLLLWRDAIPDLFRENAGMALMGSFMTQLIPEHLAERIGYFRFPEIVPDIPYYELAPTDVLMIPEASKNKALSYQFLRFFLKPENQNKLTQGSNQFALHKKAAKPQSPIALEGLKTLTKASGLMQYFDRDAPAGLAAELFPVWIEFIDKRNVSITMKKMEIIRKDFLTRASK